MVADLTNDLTRVSVPRTRAELLKLVGELFVQETVDAAELWSSQTAEQALMRLAGGSQQADLVAGVGFVRTRHAISRVAA